tara:strand:+ start:9080 stop:9274 length:195 start_codon:yes stop_codon:yes gene_type:complete
MLLHIDDAIVEIRPGEEFTSVSLVSSRFLQEITPPSKITKKKKPKTKLTTTTTFEELNGSSSRT